MEREKLIEIRTRNNWTQQHVVNELKNKFNIEITASFYGMIERGKRNPNLKVAKAIADLFETTVENIFFGNINNELLN